MFKLPCCSWHDPHIYKVLNGCTAVQAWPYMPLSHIPKLQRRGGSLAVQQPLALNKLL